MTTAQQPGRYVWMPGSLAVYQGYLHAPLSTFATYVVNAVTSAHNATYLQVVCDDKTVRDLLSSHFQPVAYSMPEAPALDITKLNAGQLVQRIMRVIDHDHTTSSISQLAEQIAAGILDLPKDYWRKPEPSPPQLKLPSEEEIARAVCCLGQVCDKRGDKGTCMAEAGLYQGEVAAVLALITPSPPMETDK